MTADIDRSVLPAGVVIRPLACHEDARGSLTEIYREGWELGCRAVQLNAVSSVAGTLRGVHVHVHHADHLVVVGGRMMLGLHDLRPWSPTAGASCMIDLDAGAPRAAVIPVGVAHGFFFPVPSVVIYGVSHYWDPADELGCRWDDAALKLAWPTGAPILSDRDATAGDYASMCRLFAQAWRGAGERRGGETGAGALRAGDLRAGGSAA